MNLEEKLNKSLNDILRTSGYVFEIINNNKRQSNLVTGPNSQLIPPPMMDQLSQKIAGFDSILDETVSKFNDTPWCIDQIIQNKKKQEEQKIKEELERQQRAEEEKQRREEEALAEKKKKEEEEELAHERERLEKEEREKRAREEAEAEIKAKKVKLESERQAKLEAERQANRQCNIQGNLQVNSQGNPHGQIKHNADYSTNNDPQNKGNLSQEYLYQTSNQNGNNDPMNGSNDIINPAFDLDMDGDKGLDIPNPSDILSMNFKDDVVGCSGGRANGLPNINSNNMEIDSAMKGDDSLLNDFNMELLGDDFGDGLGATGEEEFDVENFLNQFGNGD